MVEPLVLRHHARGLALTEAGRNFYQELLGFPNRAVVDTAPPYVLVSSTHRRAARHFAEVELRELAGEPMVLLDLPHSSAYLGARLTRRAQPFSAACRARYARPAPEPGS
ncbi:MAG TPA: hypothetical protein VGP05_16945 [Pseudonocardia sp.]|nr:hypothetical protein [Pseudonocardia sp.]